MPSDAKKKREAKKKEAAKTRGQKKPVENGSEKEENGVNGITENGENGNSGRYFFFCESIAILL